MSHKTKHTNWRLATAQLPDVQNNPPLALEIIKKEMANADRAGVTILCFPECFLQGYTLNEEETRARALTLDSTHFTEILGALAGYKTTAIIGLIEEENGSYFNTAVIIREGRLIGKYRKVHLFEKNFQPGNTYPIFMVDGLTFGVNICYDARFAEGAVAMAEKGARAIFYLLNNRLLAEKAIKHRDKHVPNLIERAKETGCWIISSDVVTKDETHIGFGYSAVVDPNGCIISRANELEVTTMIAALE